MIKGTLRVLTISFLLTSSIAADICENQINGARMPHPDDCTKFVVCRQGKTSAINTCPLGLHFNRFESICDAKERAACDDSYSPKFAKAADICTSCSVPTPELRSTGPSGTSCENSGKCSGKPDGTLIADPNSTGYIVCQCQCEIAMPCAPGTAFNQSLQTCDHIGGGGGPSTGPSGTTCANSGKCAGKPDGTLIADPNSTGYIECQCQCEIAKSCAPGTAFNQSLQTCDHIGGGGGPSTGPSGTTCANSGKCAGKPDGTLIADPNSTGYIECQCQCEIVKSCAPGTAFNESLQTCDHISSGVGNSTGPSGTTCANSGKCAGKPDGTLIADPNSTGYIVCQCQCEIAMPCAPGTAFNQTLQTCDHIGSGGGPSTGPSGTTCANSGKCAGKPDGSLIADPNSTGYIECQCQCEIAKSCAPGTAFNQTLQKCDHIGGGGGPSTGPSGTTCANSGKCAGKPDGTLIADPNSTGYIECQCQCEIAKSCAPGTAFNQTLQTCDHTGGGGGPSTGPSGTTCANSGKCAGKPDGTLIADPNSTGYIECQCQCEIAKSCAPGTAFSQTLQKCEQISTGGGPSTGPSGTTCANSGKCAGKPDGTLITDPNSNGYIVCQCQCEIAMPCAPGTAFNQTLQTCDHIGGGGGPSTGPSGTTCANSGKCAGKPDGTLIADPNSTGYIECQCQCEIAMPCAPGTAFNQTLQTCDHIGGGGGPSTGPSGTTCANSGKCAGKPDGTLIADPNSTGYIECQCQCEIAKSCAPGTAFNQTLQKCDHIGGGGGPSTGPSGTTCANSGKCAGRPDGTLIADPNSTGYIECQCQCEIAKSCAPGTAFNQTLQTCDHTGGGGGPSTGPSGTTCANSGKCAGKPDGTLIADPNSTGYIECQCQCEIAKSCAPGTAFNQTLQKCEQISTGGGPSTGPSGTTCANSGKCAGKPDGTLITDPNSNGYIVCQCQCEIAMPCAPGTAFNQTLQTCDHIGGGGGPSTGPSGTTCANSGKCAGKPDGTLIADPNSTGYIECQCQCEIAMPCAPGTAFNQTLQTCDHIGGGGGPSTGPSGTTCANSGKCAEKPDGTLIADPNSNGYIVCQCQCEIAMPCAPGTAFNQTLQTCDHIGGGGGPSTGPSGTTCANSGKCAGKPDGTLIADPNSTGYIECQCQCEIAKSCAPGTAFNQTLQRCDHIGGGGGPSTGPSGTTCMNSGRCAGKPDGTLIADPNSTGYIVCQCQCEIGMPCAPGTAFNESLQTCDHIGCGSSAGCGRS